MIEQRSESLPRFLVVLPSHCKCKYNLYQLGMLDYLSYPFIGTELIYRIEQSFLYLARAQLTHQSATICCQFVENELDGRLSTIEQHRNLVERSIHYLSSRLAQEIKLDQLCRYLGTNRNKLSLAFKSCLDTTVFNWLYKTRMQLASELLLKTDKSVVEIAERVGYLDSNNFSTAFKRMYQLSPNQYRKSGS